LILTNVCPALTFVPSARILWSHNPSSGTQISTVFGYNFSAGAHKRPLSLSETSAYFTAIAEFHLSLLFSPLQEDNVAIAIAMNGINIFFMSMI
jgi:hypothetical protein